MNSEDSDEQFADRNEEMVERMDSKYGEIIRNLDILKLAGVQE
jgi:hypothetical protein